MRIQGEHLFQAPRETVWRAVLDPATLSCCLPGFERLEQTGDNEYEGALDIRVGPVQGKFQGKLVLSDLDPPAGYRFKMSGKGAAGFVDGDGTLRLEETGGGTNMAYEVDAKVGGRIAGVGQRLLDSSAKVLTRQALEGLEQRITPPAAATTESSDEAAAAPASPRPPSQTRFATRFATELAGELVPPKHRPLAFTLAVVLYTIAVVLITRACS